jgi:hypothetical protein
LWSRRSRVRIPSLTPRSPCKPAALRSGRGSLSTARVPRRVGERAAEVDLVLIRAGRGQLGKIAKEQRAGEWDVWQTTLHNPDFSAFARNCGAFGVRVADRGELDAALAEAVAHDGPAMVEVMTDPDLV